MEALRIILKDVLCVLLVSVVIKFLVHEFINNGEEMSRKIFTAIVASGLAIFSGSAFAAHPLVTDDTGTQGTGKFQIEVNGEYVSDKTRSGGVTTKVTAGEAGFIFSYGITDSTDLVVGMPYQRFQVKEDGITLGREDGLADLGFEVKHRFYEKDGLGLGVKPAVTLPTGNEEKAFGTGKPSYGLTFIVTKEIEPVTFHFNAGYAYGDYKIEADAEANRKGIWHVSLAAEYGAAENLKLVANIGAERNADKASVTPPAFVLGGLIYSLTENFDINGGVKAGLNNAEADVAFLTGLAIRM